MAGNLAYQDDFEEKRRVELIGGKAVMMAPASSDHNHIAGNIHGIFWGYLRGKTCVPFGDNEKVFLSASDRFVPDFMVVCDPDKIKENGVYGAPDLVAEILSKNTAKRDRWHKKQGYEATGVPELWLVEPSTRAIEVYLLQEGRYVLDNIYTLFSETDLEMMTDRERSEVVNEFKCHLFDDLVIRLEDVFYRLF